MGNCTNCNSLLEPGDQFCGECGARVAKAKTAGQPPVRPEAGQSQTTLPSQKSPLSQLAVVIGIGVVALAIFYYFSSQGSDNRTSIQKTSVSTKQQTNTPTESEKPKIAELQPDSSAIVPETESRNDTPTVSPRSAIAAYVQKAIDANISNGISALAPHQIVVASCSKCAPFLIYCVNPIKNVEDLSGRKTRAGALEARKLVKRVGGNLQLLPFSEVQPALKLGVIECSISGGGVPPT